MNENLQLLQQAAAEIRGLRQQNQLMAARLDVFDKMTVMFHTQPNYPTSGMSPDICYQIDKLIASQEGKDNSQD